MSLFIFYVRMKWLICAFKGRSFVFYGKSFLKKQKQRERPKAQGFLRGILRRDHEKELLRREREMAVSRRMSTRPRRGRRYFRPGRLLSQDFLNPDRNFVSVRVHLNPEDCLKSRMPVVAEDCPELPQHFSEPGNFFKSLCLIIHGRTETSTSDDFFNYLTNRSILQVCVFLLSS